MNSDIISTKKVVICLGYQKIQYHDVKEGNVITFDYTATGLTQQNNSAEQKFATLFGWVSLISIGVNFIDSWKHILWAEAAYTATLLENCIFKTGNEMSNFNHALGREKWKQLYYCCKDLVKNASWQKKKN